MIAQLFPGLRQLQGYRLASLPKDLIAGLSVSIVLIPSSIAYAQLIGLPPQHGLYASLIPLLLYPLFGSSKQLIVGPDIAISLLIASAIAPIALGDPQHALTLAGMIAILAGLLLFLGSRVHLGALADLFSKPVLVGYMTGAALILMCSQVDKLLGLKLQHGDFLPRLYELSTKVVHTHMPTLIFAIALSLVVLLNKRFLPKFPVAASVSGLALVVSLATDLTKHGIQLVGSFPHNLPHPQIPMVPLRELSLIFPAAMGIALLTYTEAILLARSFAEKQGEEVKPNQELTGLGLADICNGFFQGFAVTGSQSRTVVNVNSGAKSQIAGITAAVFLLLFILFLTPLVAKLPLVALAVILIYGGWTLVDFTSMWHIYRRYPQSGVIAAMTTAGVLIAGVIPGIMAGVALSLYGLITRVARPTDAVLSHIPGDGFHDLGQNPKETLPGVIIYRFYAPILFTNSAYFFDRIKQLITEAPGLKYFIIDAQATTDMDVTAAETMDDVCDYLKKQNVQLEICHANLPFRKALERGGILEKLGNPNLYSSAHECAAALGIQET